MSLTNPVCIIYLCSAFVLLILEPVTLIAQALEATTTTSCFGNACRCTLEREVILKCSEESIQSLLNNTQDEQTRQVKHFVCNMCNLPHFPSKVISNIPQVESIDLSHNRFTEITELPRSTHLKHLNLSNNLITSINLRSLLDTFPHLLTLDLNNNQIQHILSTRNSFFGSLRALFISGNPIDCSNNLNTALLKAIADQPRILTVNVAIVDSATTSPSRMEARCSPFGRLANISLTSAYEISTLEVCNTCDCKLVREKASFSVNCSNRALNELPRVLPPSTKIVHLNNNNIKTLNFNSPTWNAVIYLYLSNNSIEYLDGLEGQNILDSVRHLDLNSNRLTQVSAHVLKQLQVDQLRLSNNPWRCDCGIIPLQLWIQEQFSKLLDLEDTRCAGPSSETAKNGLSAHNYNYVSKLANKVIYQIPSFDLCPQPSGLSSGYKVLDGLCFLLLTLTVLIMLKTAYDWWWQRRTGRLPEFFKVNF